MLTANSPVYQWLRRAALPGDTAQAIANVQYISNLGLFWDKYCPRPLKNSEGKEKEEFLKLFIHRFNSNAEIKTIIGKLVGRQNNYIEDGKRSGYQEEKFEGEVVWRMAIGLGVKQPFTETGITLYHPYGIPYIPGTAAKGMARSFAFSSLAEKLGIEMTDPETYAKLIAEPHPEKAPREKLDEALTENWKLQRILSICDFKSTEQSIGQEVQNFINVFGSKQAEGKVIFLDALPLQLKLQYDIINVHYPDYYNNDDVIRHPPADYDSPNPIFFLALGEGTSFLFRVISRDNSLANLALAIKWLRASVQEIGAGAKTRAGYGELKACSSEDTENN